MTATLEQVNAALAAMRFEVLSLEPGKTIGYWKLMDLFDHGVAEVSHALEDELRKLAKAKEIRFKKDEEGAENIVVRLAAKKKSAAKKSAPKKKTPAKKPVKKAPAKRKPAKKR